MTYINSLGLQHALYLGTYPIYCLDYRFLRSMSEFYFEQQKVPGTVLKRSLLRE